MLDEKEPKPNILIRRIDVTRCVSPAQESTLPLPRACDKMDPGDYLVYSDGCTYFAQWVMKLIHKVDDGSGDPKLKIIGPREFPTFSLQHLTASLINCVRKTGRKKLLVKLRKGMKEYDGLPKAYQWVRIFYSNRMTFGNYTIFFKHELTLSEWTGCIKLSYF